MKISFKSENNKSVNDIIEKEREREKRYLIPGIQEAGKKSTCHMNKHVLASFGNMISYPKNSGVRLGKPNDHFHPRKTGALETSHVLGDKAEKPGGRDSCYYAEGRRASISVLLHISFLSVTAHTPHGNVTEELQQIGPRLGLPKRELRRPLFLSLFFISSPSL